MDKKDKLSLTNSKKIIKKWQELELNPKEIKFLAEYINNGFNGTRAYLKTIARKGTCYSAAGAEATSTLKKVKIKLALDEWKQDFLNNVKNELEAKIIDNLMSRCFYDIEDYYYDDGVLKPLSKLRREQRQAIDGVEVKYFGKDAVKTVTYKLADKDKARLELEKYINLIKDSMDINIQTDLNEKLEETITNAIRNYKRNKLSESD